MALLAALLALIGSALTIGYLSDTVPTWLGYVAELIGVTAVFVIVCLVESGVSRRDETNSSAS